MSMDKWFTKYKSKEEKNKIEEFFKVLPEEKVQELKKKSVRDLTQRKRKNKEIKNKPDDFLSYVIEFKDWLNKRTYLKGDIDKIETWIRNLNKKLDAEKVQGLLAKNNVKSQLINQFRKIPHNILDEKTRIAINKKIREAKRNSSDNYYLRKLKTTIQEKLKEASYYGILKKILEFKDI
ncbi:MAG: hypothetical protein ACFE8A_08065 [Candidatus Hodarchaeota archaeon]